MRRGIRESVGARLSGFSRVLRGPASPLDFNMWVLPEGCELLIGRGEMSAPETALRDDRGRATRLWASPCLLAVLGSLWGSERRYGMRNLFILG